MKSLIVAAALVAGALALPTGAGAASYAPTAAVAAHETAGTWKTDVHGPDYRAYPLYGFLREFLPPYRYGYSARHYRYDRRHDGDWRHNHRDRDRKNHWHRRHDHDDDFDVEEWNRNARRNNLSR